jgi:hypothetical protein
LITHKTRLTDTSSIQGLLKTLVHQNEKCFRTEILSDRYYNFGQLTSIHHHGKMTKSEIAQAFSNGEFEKAYNYIADDAIWVVVEENTFRGKQAILENGAQVGHYFKTITSNFKTLNIIADANKVVINGTAEFLRDRKRVSFVSACDIYEFNSRNQIQHITSYCIQSK